MLPVTLFSTSVLVGGTSTEGHTDLYGLGNGTLAAIRYQNEHH